MEDRGGFGRHSWRPSPPPGVCTSERHRAVGERLRFDPEFLHEGAILAEHLDAVLTDRRHRRAARNAPIAEALRERRGAA
jgi:hypothetical protein